MTDVERWWFRVHGTNQEMTFRYFTEDNLDADFEDLDEPDAPAVLAAFWEEVGQARAAVRDLDLDHVVPSHGHHPERVRDLRWIYIHMIEEYARHNGHADLLRERIDGVTGDWRRDRRRAAGRGTSGATGTGGAAGDWRRDRGLAA